MKPGNANHSPRFWLRTLLALIVLSVPAAAVADSVLLKDGSTIRGTLHRYSSGDVVIDTAFAGRLTIAVDQVRGVNTDEKVMVALDSGDEILGRLRYSPSKGQRVIETVFGTVRLTERSISAAWRRGEPSPMVAGATAQQSEKINELEAKHEAEVKALKKRTTTLAEAWSGSISLGVGGASGNTERLSIQGRGEADYETEPDRLNLYVEGRFEEQSAETTASEVLAGAKLEHDISERAFVFGQADFEQDEFQNLDLRAAATAGGGYFFVRNPPRLTFKGLVGLGYQHESFTDGSTDEQGLVSVGWDIAHQYKEWLELGHKLTYLPSLTEPSEDYRLVSELRSEMPLIPGEPWKLRLSLRNQYDSEPQPGIEELDTIYGVNVVYDWE